MDTKEIAMAIIQLASQLWENELQKSKDREVLKGKFKLVWDKEWISQNKSSICLPTQEVSKLKYKNKTIKKREDGRWWCRYYKDGKQISIYGKSQQECLNNLKKALNKNDNNQEKNYTVEQWLEKWRELYKINKVKSSSLKKIDVLTRYIKPIYDKKIDKITSIEIQEFLNSVKATRIRQLLYEQLKDCFNKAYQNKLIKENPCIIIEKPKHEKSITEALTIQQEAKFIEACKNDPYENVNLFCLYEGLRIGECCALTYNDIDFENKTIKINKTINDLGQITSPKTIGSNRTIPLFKKAEQLLNKKGIGQIFKVKPRTVQNNILKISKAVGFKIHTHKLRHTFATRCCEANIPAKVCQKWLGHSTIQMTLNVYTHVTKDFENKSAENLNNYFDTQNDT